MLARISSIAWQRPLFVAGSIVLIVAALSLAKAVIIPIVLAALLTLVLSPVVGALQRLHLGRTLSVIGAVFLAFCLLGGIGLGVVLQLRNLAGDLPLHEQEIAQKIAKIREAGRASWVVDIYDTIRDISRKIQGTEAAPAELPAGQPIPVRIESSPFPFVQSLAGPVMEALVTLGMATILLIFMLIQREDLRNRLIRLWGDTSITRTTKAFDDAIGRISRFLLMQLAINVGFGAVFAVGLYLIGVPYALVWGFLAGALRYIPYIGTWTGAFLPIALSIALLPGWTKPLLVFALFLVLEMTTYNLIEPWLFGQSIGVSATALLIAAAFWGWLWGPIGLVLATPLTACLVVLGRYVPSLEFFSVILGDEPVLEPHVVYYQRLLAKDQDEAADLVEEFMQARPAEDVYDGLLLPALILAKENRARGESTAEDGQFILEVTREIVEDLIPPRQQISAKGGHEHSTPERGEPAETPVLVFGCPARDETDELALVMFQQLLDPEKSHFKVISRQKLTAEVMAHVAEEQPKALCIASVPPQGLAHTRYLCKRLRAQYPELKILVGCWGLDHNVDRTRERLTGAGADQVAFRLVQTREQIVPLIQLHSWALTQQETAASP